MLKFNTQAITQSRLFNPHEQVVKVFPKTLLASVMFVLCCIGLQNTAYSQPPCNPDMTPPNITCHTGTFVVNLTNNTQSLLITNIVSSSSDDCGDPVVSLSPNPITCAQVGTTVTVTATAINDEGLMASCTRSVEVNDVAAPVFTFCPPDVTVDCGESTDPSNPNVGMATATDNCDMSPSVTWSDPPAAPGSTCRTIVRTWTAADGVPNSNTSCVQTITVADNDPPTIVWPSPGTPPAALVNLDCDMVPPPSTLAITATDDCAVSPALSWGVDPDVSTQGADPAACDFYNYTITRVYWANDGCNPRVEYIQVFNVSDDEDPVFSGTSSFTETVAGTACEANVDLNGLVSVDDNCANGYLLVSFVVRDITDSGNPVIVNPNGSGLDASDTYDVGQYEIEFLASDPCGGQSTFTLNLTVEDQEAPTALCKTSAVVSVPNSGTATPPGNIVDNGSFDACGDVSFTIDPPSFNCPIFNTTPPFFCSGSPGLPQTVPVTLTVTDASGNIATCNSLIFVTDGSQPEVNCKDITVQLSIINPGMVIVDATDIDNGSSDACGIFSYEISKDGGITFIPSVDFDCSETGDNDVILRVTDCWGNSKTCDAVVTVEDDDDPDAVCNPIVIQLGQDGMYELTTTDINDISNGSSDNCTYSVAVTPLTMFTCEHVDNDPIAAGDQPFVYTLTVTDASGNTDACTSTITVKDNTPPMISCDNVEVCLDADGEYTFVGEEMINGDIYISSSNNGSSFTNDTTRLCITVTKPVDLSFDFEYTTQNTHVGWDPFGYSVDGVFTPLYPNNPADLCNNNIPNPVTPVTGNSGPISLLGSQVFCFEAPTCDNILGRSETWISNFSEILQGDYDPTNWYDDSTPDNDGKWFFFDACDPVTFEVSLDDITYDDDLTFDCGDVFVNSGDEIDVWVRAEDVNGNISTSCMAEVTVLDKQAPVAGCDEVVKALDGDGNAIIYANEFDQGSYDECTGIDLEISLDGITGTFSGSFVVSCPANLGETMVVLKVEDDYGNEAFCMTTLQIDDKLAPVFTMCPSSVTISCGDFTGDVPDEAITGMAMAEDNCTDPVVPTYTDAFVPAVNSQPNCRTINRTWMASDGASPANTSLCLQVITVEDNEDPVLSGNFSTVTSECDPPVVTPPTATDNCDDDVDIQTVIEDNRFNYATNPPTQLYFEDDCEYYRYDILYTWTATDNCMNDDVETKLVQVRDTEAPVITFDDLIQVDNQTGTCSAPVSIELTAADVDDCADFQYLTIEYSTDNGATWQTGNTISGTYVVGFHDFLFRATDPCGQTSTNHMVTLEVRDVQSPQAFCHDIPNAALDNTCNAAISPLMVNNFSNDNCGIVNYEVQPSSFTGADLGDNNVTLTVTDAAGNSNSCIAIVTVVLPSAPTITCPNDITVECTDVDNLSITGGAVLNFSPACLNLPDPTPSDMEFPAGISDPYCYYVERTWSGSGASCVQTIYVQDTSDPVLSGVPTSNVTVGCPTDVPPMPTVTATDNCTDPQVVVPSSVSTQGSDPSLCSYYEYNIVRSWSATDDCDNTTSDSYTVFVDDETAPKITIPNGELVFGNDQDVCEATIAVNLLEYIEDCAEDQYLTVTHTSLGTGANLAGTFAVGTYSVSVTAVDPCGNSSTVTFDLIIEDDQTPVGKCFTDITLVLDNTGNGAITVADVDDNSYDNCAIVDYDLSQTDFTTADVGIVPVTMIVEDAAGNQNDCITTVTVIGDVTCLVDDVNGALGETIEVPVHVQVFNDVTMIDITVEIDGSIGTVTGINMPNAALAGAVPSFTGTTGTFMWSGGLPGVSLPDGDILFKLEVMVDNAATIGDASPVEVTSLAVSQMVNGNSVAVSPYSEDGSITVVNIASSHTISGVIVEQPDCGSDPILHTNVAYSGDMNGLLLDQPGAFSLVVGDGNDITFEPAKNTTYYDVNITAFDALNAHLYAVGLPTIVPVSPYQIIAMDATGNNSVTTYDALLIHQQSAGLALNTNDYPTPWRFVDQTATFGVDPFATAPPESISYTNVTMDHSDADFYGIMMGDVVSPCADPSNLISGETTDEFADDIQMVVTDREIAAGETVQIAFKTNRFEQMMAMQYTLNFDQTMMELNDVASADLVNLNAQSFNSTHVEEGMLAVSWYHIEPVELESGEVAFTLEFTALEDISTLVGLVEISSDLILEEAVNASGIVGGIDLIFENALTSSKEQLNDAWALHQNRPNPFTSETTIGFTLAEGTAATLTITDASGKVLRVIEGDYSAGTHQVRINHNDLAAKGVIFYRLDTPRFTAVRKMVLLD